MKRSVRCALCVAMISATASAEAPTIVYEEGFYPAPRSFTLGVDVSVPQDICRPKASAIESFTISILDPVLPLDNDPKYPSDSIIVSVSVDGFGAVQTCFYSISITLQRAAKVSTDFRSEDSFLVFPDFYDRSAVMTAPAANNTFPVNLSDALHRLARDIELRYKE